MVQINRPPDEPERLEDIEPILPPRDRWPDQRLQREAAKSFHWGPGLLVYLAAVLVCVFFGELFQSVPVAFGTGAVVLLVATAIAYIKFRWRRFPLTMLIIPTPVIILVVIEILF